MLVRLWLQPGSRSNAPTPNCYILCYHLMRSHWVWTNFTSLFPHIARFFLLGSMNRIWCVSVLQKWIYQVHWVCAVIFAILPCTARRSNMYGREGRCLLMLIYWMCVKVKVLELLCKWVITLSVAYSHSYWPQSAVHSGRLNLHFVLFAVVLRSSCVNARSHRCPISDFLITEIT
jgi:hypothetical protein